MENNLVSVIIPTYNRALTVKRSVLSVINQSYKNIEILIIDDCSTDNTFQIIESLNDNRLKYYRNNENIGACASRNIGIRLSKGDLIAFQDSDDYWYPDKLETQISYLINKQCDIVFCKMRNVYDNTIFPKEQIDYNKSLYMQFLMHNKAGTQTIIGRSECFINNLFDEKMPRFQEWELMIRLSRIYNIFQLENVFVDYYIQSDSISKQYNKGLIAIERIFKLYYQDIISDPLIHFNYLTTISQYLIATNESAVRILFKALTIHFNLKILIKFILCLFGFSWILRKRWKI